MVTTYCFEIQCQPWQLFLWTGLYLQLSHDAFKSSIVPFCACFVLSSHVRCKIVFLDICSNKSNTNDYPLCWPKCHCGSTGISLLNSWLLEYQRHRCYFLLMKIKLLFLRPWQAAELGTKQEILPSCKQRSLLTWNSLIMTAYKSKSQFLRKCQKFSLELDHFTDYFTHNLSHCHCISWHVVLSA